MPPPPFLLPGVGAQGGDVAALAPAFAPGRAGGLVTASRSIAHAHEAPAATPPTAARAEAERLRERVGTGLKPGPPEPPLSSASMAGRSPARFLAPLALVAFAVALFVDRDRHAGPGGRERPEPRARRRGPTATPRRQAPAQGPPALHGQARRHAVVDRREDRRPARGHPAPEPRPGPAGPQPRPAAQAPPVSARAGARAAIVAGGRRPPARAPRERGGARLPRRRRGAVRDRARGLDRRGRVRARGATRGGRSARRSKLMTALRHARARRARRDLPRRPSYRPAPAESRIGLQPGERMTVRDLLSGLLVASGNDAAMTLAEGVAGSERAFVRLMNRRARELGLENTRYGEPDRARRGGRLLERARPRRAGPPPAPDAAVLPPRRRPAAGDAHLRRPPRTLTNRNTLVAGVDWVNGVKTGYTQQAGDVLVGSGRRRRIQVVSAVLDEPSKAARNADTLALLSFGTAPVPARSPPRPRARAWGSRADPLPPGRRARARRRAQRERTVVPRGQRDARDHPAGQLAVARSEGPIAAGQELGRAEVLRDGRRIATRAAGGRRRGPRGRARAAHQVLVHHARWPSCCAFAVLGGTVLLARRRRRPRGQRARRARDEARVA